MRLKRDHLSSHLYYRNRSSFSWFSWYSWLLNTLLIPKQCVKPISKSRVTKTHLPARFAVLWFPMAPKLNVKKLWELQFYLLHRDLCHVNFHRALCGEMSERGHQAVSLPAQLGPGIRAQHLSASQFNERLQKCQCESHMNAKSARFWGLGKFTQQILCKNKKNKIK